MRGHATFKMQYAQETSLLPASATDSLIVPVDFDLRLARWLWQRSDGSAAHDRRGRNDHEWYVPSFRKQQGLSDQLFYVVPVNLKDRDAFHLTIEEYLLALISLLDELVRHYTCFAR
jgi:hypothetical protein